MSSSSASPDLARSGSWRRLGPRLDQPFDEVGGNRVVPFDDSAKSFGDMLAAIESATVSVDLEMYLWDSDALGLRFVEAVSEAARRGVRVRLLVDGFGAREIIGPPLRTVETAGGSVRVFNPVRFPLGRGLVRRTHKKLLVLDGRTAYCGGAGFSEWFHGGKEGEPAWHDRMFRLEGPVVDQLELQFAVDFARWGPRESRCGPTVPVEPAAFAGPARDGPAGPSVGRVLRGWPDARDFPPALLEALDGAESVIRIGTPYFVPRFPLMRALMRALKRGVRVQLVVPSPEYANLVLWHGSRRYLGPLLRRGAEIRLFAASFYHAKIAVVDDHRALIGSSNLDGWSWRRNAELDLVFTDAETAASLTACFERDWSASIPLTPLTFRVGGLWSTFASWVADLVRRWM